MTAPFSRGRSGTVGDLLRLAPLFLLFWLHGLGKWGPFYWDTAREIILPRRILAGEFPFRDFEILYGPLSYHFTAVLLRFFGNHLWVDRMLNTVLLASTLGLLLHLAVKSGLPRRWRLVLGALFLSVCAFPPRLFAMAGYLMPFSQAGAWTPVFCLSILAGILRFIQGGRMRWLLVASALCGWAGLFVRLDSAPGLAFCLILVLFLPWVLRRDAAASRRLACSFGCLLLALLPGAIWLAGMSSLMPIRLLFERLLEIRYYMGTGQVSPFLWRPFLRVGLFFALLALTWRFVVHAHGARLPWVVAWAAPLVAFVGYATWRGTLYFQFFFGTVFLCSVAALWQALRLWGKWGDSKRWGPLVLAAGGLAFLCRVFSGGEGYFFTFSSPSALLGIFVGLWNLHRWAADVLEQHRLAGALGACACLGILILSLDTLRIQGEQTLRFEAPWGVVHLPASSDEARNMSRGWAWAAGELRKATGEGERVYSYSPDLPLNVLAGRLPSGYDQCSGFFKSRFEDGAFVSFAEERLIADMERQGVRWVALDSNGVSAMANALTRWACIQGKIPSRLTFGVELSPRLAGWIRRNYVEIASHTEVSSAGNAGYQIVLLQRHEAVTKQP